MADVRDTVFEQLRSMGIAFEWIEHAAAHTMEECRIPAEQLNALMPKNLFLAPRNHSLFYLLIMRPDAEFRTSDISHQLGVSRLGFAPQEKLWEFMHTKPGAISPMGLLFDEGREVRVAVDEELLKAERLAFHPCENTSSLAMSKEAFFKEYLSGLGRNPEFVKIG
ncbi:MAG: prolyl-tRNA synthetase associated domain-containing protein [Clostridiales bacterium]|nr:prolyl-tRNA synthetase associated domain-containing protein [Clostridiales bacterium]